MIDAHKAVVADLSYYSFIILSTISVKIALARTDLNRVSSLESMWLPVTLLDYLNEYNREEQGKTFGCTILILLLILTGEPGYRIQHGEYATSLTDRGSNTRECSLLQNI
jgi:hypothetical protein